MNISEVLNDFISYKFITEQDILNLYKSLSYNYNSINEIAEKGDIISDDFELDIYAGIIIKDKVLIIYSNNLIYWYSKYGHLHNYKCYFIISAVKIQKNKIYISSSSYFPDITIIKNFKKSKYKICNHKTKKVTISCDNCTFNCKNIKSARN